MIFWLGVVKGIGYPQKKFHCSSLEKLGVRRESLRECGLGEKGFFYNEEVLEFLSPLQRGGGL